MSSEPLEPLRQILDKRLAEGAPSVGVVAASPAGMRKQTDVLREWKRTNIVCNATVFFPLRRSLSMRVLAWLCALAMLCTAPLRAQRTESPAVAPGERVRVSLMVEGPRLAGQVYSLGSQSLLLQVGDEPAPRVLPVASIQSLEVSRGRPRASWTFLGAVLGATAGVIYTRASGEESDPADIGGLYSTAEGVGNVVTGMLAGAVLGWLIAPERWSIVPLTAPTR